MKINLFKRKDITKKELKQIINTYLQKHPNTNFVFAKIEAIKYYRDKIEELTGCRPGIKESKEKIDSLLLKWKLT